MCKIINRIFSLSYLHVYDLSLLSKGQSIDFCHSYSATKIKKRRFSWGTRKIFRLVYVTSGSSDKSFFFKVCLNGYASYYSYSVYYDVLDENISWLGPAGVYSNNKTTPSMLILCQCVFFASLRVE